MDPQQPQQPDQREQPPPAEAPPPQQQSGWAPPQQPSGSGWGPTGPVGPERPGGVTFAGIYLIVMGVLMALSGAACGLLGGAIGGMADLDETGFAGVFGGAIAVFGIIVLVLGIISIVGGVGALQGKGWGRWTGVTVSVIAALFMALAVLSSLQGGIDLSATVLPLIVGILYALAAWALIKAGPYFAYRR